MEENMIFSSPKHVSNLVTFVVGICVTLIVLSSACSSFSGPQSPVATPSPVLAPDPFPATDIVYRGVADLGFVNADGSNGTTVPYKLPSTNFVSTWESPMIAGGDETLIVTRTQYPGVPGNIFVARAGDILVECGWYGIARLAVDGYHILLETDKGQEKYLPAECGTGKPPEKIYPGVVGALSPDEGYSAEAARRGKGADDTASIILHDLKTGKERLIGEGDFPVWSRDGQWLAYTGADGIYIVQNNPNVEPRRLVKLEIPHPEFGRRVYTVDPANLYYPPIASWSPDGKWLVYHEYHVGSDAEFPEQYSILKVNVETRETFKLLDGGYSPFWRWPVEKP